MYTATGRMCQPTLEYEFLLGGQCTADSIRQPSVYVNESSFFANPNLRSRSDRRWIRLTGLVNIALLILLGQSTTPLTAHAISPSSLPLADSNAGWEEVGAGSASAGGISDNYGVSVYPSLAISPDGTPYIAWEDWSDSIYNLSVFVAIHLYPQTLHWQCNRYLT